LLTTETLLFASPDTAFRGMSIVSDSYVTEAPCDGETVKSVPFPPHPSEGTVAITTARTMEIVPLQFFTAAPSTRFNSGFRTTVFHRIHRRSFVGKS
jgi:hypothetical protein